MEQLTKDHPNHPLNDPAFLARPRPDPANPANDPTFIFDLAERMEEDEALREAVWSFFSDGDLEFLLHDGQRDMFEMLLAAGDAKEFLIFCSRQFGKSFFILLLAIIHCARPYGKRRPLVRIFCETVKQVEDIVNDNMQLILQLAPPGYIKRVKTDNRWLVGVGEIRMCPLARAHVDGKRGGNATLVITEEGGFSPSDDYRKAIGSVINPQLLRSGGLLVHVTTPSEDVGHYIHQVVLPKTKRAGASARKTIYENPQLSDDQIIAAFERCTSLEEWLREYMVRVVKSEISTVVPEYDDERNVRDMELPAFAFWQTALDFGGTVDKHALILTFYDFERAKLCVWDERFLEKNTPTKGVMASGEEMEREAQAALAAKRSVLWLSGHPRRVSDCPGQVLVDLRAEGWTVRTPEKEKGSFEAGISAIRVAFMRDQIEIHPRCHWLRQSLELGQFTENRKDFARTAALGHLDLIAALIYAWRHKNVTNPFPHNVGKHREIHHTRGNPEPADVLASAFLPSFLR